MAGDNDREKKGFAGLSSLASEVCAIEEPIKPEPKKEAKPSTHKQPRRPQREAAPSEPERKTQSSPPTIEAVSSGKNQGGSGGKWIIGITGVVFVVWLINSGDQGNKKPSYSRPSSSQSYSYPQSTPAPAVQTQSTTQSASLQYTKPSVGTNNVLAVPEIRWCLREGIRIDTKRAIANTDGDVDAFNVLVWDYNGRCGKILYRGDALERATREVEKMRSQIVADTLGQFSLPRSGVPRGPWRRDEELGEVPAVWPVTPPEREALDTPSGYVRSTIPRPAQPAVNPSFLDRQREVVPAAPPVFSYDREIVSKIQRQLNRKGYAAGPEDGIVGKRTSAAISAFQRDHDLPMNGFPSAEILAAINASGPLLKSYHPSSTSPRKIDRRIVAARSSDSNSAGRDIEVESGRLAGIGIQGPPPESRIQQEKPTRSNSRTQVSTSHGPSLIGVPSEQARQISDDCLVETDQLDVSGYKRCLHGALRRKGHASYEPRRQY